MKISYDLDLHRLKEFIDKNPKSPLFARYADKLAQKGLINEALIVIENGLKYHRLYSTAYIVYAKILMMKGMDEEALENLRKVIKLSPFCMTAHTLIEKILNKKFSTRMKAEGSSQKQFIRRQKSVDKNEIEAILEKFNNSDSLIIKADPNFDKTYEPPSETPEIVTETMFHILLNQGLFEKAYQLLLKLMDKNPSRRDYYSQQLEILKKRLSIP